MVTTWASLIALTTLVVAVELQVRVVEEPYLRRTHPQQYPAYTAQVGRFLPHLCR
jgi:protein-S-isoprenylcysteine O-methyltransferase Ste14